MIYSFENIAPDLADDCFVADNATLIGKVILHPKSSIWFGAVLRGDIEPIEIGENSNIQDNSVVHTKEGCPVKVGKNVSVGHLVNLHGCEIGDNCLIGMGSTILDGAVIGENCIVGANSLVSSNKKFPAGSLIIGSPARVARSLTDDEILAISKNAEHYSECYPKYLNR